MADLGEIFGTAVTKDITVTIKAPQAQINEVEANVKKILAKATPEDIEGIAKLVDNPGKLKFARSFMK